MTLDLFTASFMTAIVCNVAGAAFIVETLLRRDEGMGRVWSLAFLCGMATTIAYMMWASGVGGFVAVALGNALFVSTTGCMWLGSRRFNQRSLLVPGGVVVGAAMLTAGAVLLDGPAGGDWAGWIVMGLVLVGLAALACVETFRAPMRRIRSAWALGVVLGAEAVFYLARVVVFVAVGPDSAVFTRYFSTNAASVVTVVLTIVGVVVVSVLRASHADLREYVWMSRAGVSSDGILEAATFEATVVDMAQRAEWRRETVSIISVRVEDLRQIGLAFGVDVAGAVAGAWRQGVRRFAPSASVVGEDGATGLMVATIVGSAAEARREAAAIYRGLFQSLGGITGAVIPVVGVGVALSETVGYDIDALMAAAREAAARAAVSPDASVAFGGTDAASRRLEG